MSRDIERVYYVVFTVLLVFVIALGVSSCSSACWGFNGYLRLANFSSRNTGFLLSGNWVLNLFLQFYLGLFFLVANIFGVLTGRKPCIYTAIISAVSMIFIEIMINGYFYPAFPRYAGIGSIYSLLVFACMTLIVIIQIFIPLLYKYRSH